MVVIRGVGGPGSCTFMHSLKKGKYAVMVCILLEGWVQTLLYRGKYAVMVVYPVGRPSLGSPCERGNML
jgi:hypothetical protein